MSTTAVPPVKAAAGGRWNPGAVAGVIAGSILGLIALALALGGLAMVVMHAVARDDDGYLHSPTRHFSTPGYALTVERVQVGDMHGGALDWAVEELDGRVRVRAELRDASAVFVGIARERDLARYLSGVAHGEIRDFGHHRADLLPTAGTHRPALPAQQRFWVASATGRGAQTAQWKVTTGRWAAVVMRADAGRGVNADVRAGARIGGMLWVGLILLAVGAAGFAGSVALIAVAGGRGRTWGSPPAAPAGSSMSAALTAAADDVAAASRARPHPVQVRAELDEPLSRWYWLVKWALVIPHVIVLAVLWAGFVVSALAGVTAVVLTGRYPRSLFDFNVGVMRWTWRVELYANGAFATDRYPPFSLAPDPTYPADLEVPYPDQPLPRLQTAFQWLLAVPHWLIIGALVGGGWWFEERVPGLLPVLVVIAVLTLLFTGRYPRELFRLIVGIHRWVLRTIAYAAGLRPEYPPFTLDR